MPRSVPLDPQTLLSAYAHGAFPMADHDGRIGWYTADPRGIIPLDTFHVPGTLRQLVRKSPAEGGFEVRIDLRLPDGETTWVQVSRGRADELNAQNGESVWVSLSPHAVPSAR